MILQSIPGPHGAPIVLKPSRNSRALQEPSWRVRCPLGTRPRTRTTRSRARLWTCIQPFESLAGHSQAARPHYEGRQLRPLVLNECDASFVPGASDDSVAFRRSNVETRLGLRPGRAPGAAARGRAAPSRPLDRRPAASSSCDGPRWGPACLCRDSNPSLLGKPGAKVLEVRAGARPSTSRRPAG